MNITKKQVPANSASLKCITRDGLELFAGNVVNTNWDISEKEDPNEARYISFLEQSLQSHFPYI